MNEIRIGRGAQLVTLLAVLAGLAAAVAAQLPEIKRYLNMRSM